MLLRDSVSYLRLVEAERLLLHESREPSRLAALRETIASEGVQSHPVIAARHGDDYLVLDGAHRVGALTGLGCDLILVQTVEAPAKAESWTHVLETPGIPDILAGRLRSLEHRMEGVELARGERCGGELPLGVLAAVETEEGCLALGSVAGIREQARALWTLQQAYPGEVSVRRVIPGEPVEPSPGRVAVYYRRFSLDELAEVVRGGETLPAGITRFRVTERVLGVRLPLEYLRGGVEEGNRELGSFVKSILEQGRIRRYEEPVVIFE
jgi:hypothetical protein